MVELTHRRSDNLSTVCTLMLWATANAFSSSTLHRWKCFCFSREKEINSKQHSLVELLLKKKCFIKVRFGCNWNDKRNTSAWRCDAMQWNAFQSFREFTHSSRAFHLTFSQYTFFNSLLSVRCFGQKKLNKKWINKNTSHLLEIFHNVFFFHSTMDTINNWQTERGQKWRWNKKRKTMSPDCINNQLVINHRLSMILWVYTMGENAVTAMNTLCRHHAEHILFCLSFHLSLSLCDNSHQV